MLRNCSVYRAINRETEIISALVTGENKEKVYINVDPQTLCFRNTASEKVRSLPCTIEEMRLY